MGSSMHPQSSLTSPDPSLTEPNHAPNFNVKPRQDGVHSENIEASLQPAEPSFPETHHGFPTGYAGEEVSQISNISPTPVAYHETEHSQEQVALPVDMPLHDQLSSNETSAVHLQCDNSLPIAPPLLQESLGQQQGQAQALSQRQPSAVPSTKNQPARPKLVFVLLGEHGDLDLKNKIPWEELRDWTIQQFFNEIAMRQPLVYQSAMSATLACGWLQNTRFTVPRNDEQDEWMESLEAIGYLFNSVGKSFQSSRTLNIFVEVPNMRRSAW